jgi:hypothetical protein
MFAKRMGATTKEVDASHLVMVSHPTEVAQLIESAAQSTAARDADLVSGAPRSA